MLWCGVVVNCSCVVFYGGIYICEGVDGIDVNLFNKNLLFLVDVEIDIQFMLVIDVDEVKVVYGVIVGQFDVNVLFYLCLCGLFVDQVQQLFSVVFCYELFKVFDVCLIGQFVCYFDCVLVQVGVV